MNPDPSHPLNRRGRMVRRVAALTLACLLLVAISNPLLTAMGNQMLHADPLERADAIIVLAPWFDRVLEAAELYRKGYAPVVVLTREVRQPAEQLLINRGIIESGEDRRRHVLRSLGVPDKSIVILEDFVSSTIDEARAFAKWSADRPVHNVIVVTSPFHTERSRITFLRVLEERPMRVLVHPSRLGNSFERDKWWQARSTLRDGLFEWQKLMYYRFIELPRL